MDFNYTEEQQMLADTVERFVADVYSLRQAPAACQHRARFFA